MRHPHSEDPRLKNYRHPSDTSRIWEVIGNAGRMFIETLETHVSDARRRAADEYARRHGVYALEVHQA